MTGGRGWSVLALGSFTYSAMLLSCPWGRDLWGNRSMILTVRNSTHITVCRTVPRWGRVAHQFILRDRFLLFRKVFRLGNKHPAGRSFERVPSNGVLWHMNAPRLDPSITTQESDIFFMFHSYQPPYTCYRSMSSTKLARMCDMGVWG